MKEIQLQKGFVALVDDEDYEWLSKIRWYAHKIKNNIYVIARIKKEHSYMHRVVAKTPKGMTTDHIDGNGLNNQKSNLRNCLSSENLMNRGKQANNKSGYKGVWWSTRDKKYCAQIKAKGKKINLGSFDDPLDAAMAYDRAAIEFHGKYAKTNFS